MMLACDIISQRKGLNVNFDFFLERYSSFLTYGDDNIASSNVTEFNHASISSVLGEFSVLYTMTDKISKSIPFIHISQADFLKRRWVIRPNVTLYQAPLDHESIFKMLTVCTKTRSISFEQQCAEIIRAANLEYFHYGRRVFIKRHNFSNVYWTNIICVDI